MDALDNYKAAMALYNEGKPMDCLRLLLAGYKAVRNPALKIAYLQSLIVLVDPVFKLDELFAICDEGIKIATELNDAVALSYFQMKKAFCCTMKRATMLSIKKDITLAPHRINFSLESDRDLHDSTVTGMAELKQESEELMQKSLSAADQNNHDLQAHLHSILGDIYGTECSIYMLEHLRQAKLLYYFGKLGLNLRHVLSSKERAELLALSDRSVQEFLCSVSFYEKNNDNIGVASAYSNISNNLRTLGLFRQAKRYIKLSKQASNAKSIVEKRQAVESSIKDKNKNVPDYKKDFPRPVLRRDSLKNLKAKLKDWFSNTD